MRDYIAHYVDIFKSLQNRKTKLLRHESIVDSARRAYSSKIRVFNSTKTKLKSFRIFQKLLFMLFFLIHVNIKRQLFIDLNVNKKFDIEIMFYYVKKAYFQNLKFEIFFSKHVIKSILFLNRFISSAEFRYWSTKLKIIDIVWILKKTRHIVEISSSKTIIYIDHEIALDIITQITLTIIFIDKLNLKLIRVFDYIQRFNLNIRHKLDKQHVVSNALSRFFSDNIDSKIDETKNELNALFIVSLIKMNEAFRKRIIDDYKSDLNWKRITKILNVDDENVAKLFFCKKNNLIFRQNDFIIDDHVYESRRFCISHFVIQNIFHQTHDDDHVDYVKCYEQISTSYYIRDFSRYFRDYLKHCSKCQMFQIKRYVSYESLQLILSSSILFHTITMNFILIFSIFVVDLNIAMTVCCKFTKRVIFIIDKNIWIAID